MKNDALMNLVRMASEAEAVEAEAEGRAVWADDEAAEISAAPMAVRGGWGTCGRGLAMVAGLALAAVGAWGVRNAWKDVGVAKRTLTKLKTEEPGAIVAAVPERGPEGGPAEPVIETPPGTSVVAVSEPRALKEGTRSEATILPAPILPGDIFAQVWASELAMRMGAAGTGELNPLFLLMPARAAPVVAAAHGSSSQCGVVLVIVHDLSGRSRCVQVRGQDWEGRCAGDVPGGELALMRESVPLGCASGPGRQVLVVALSGPSAALPATQRGAEDVASCILGLAHTCGADGACYQGVAGNCLPEGVSFKVETVAAR